MINFYKYHLLLLTFVLSNIISSEAQDCKNFIFIFGSSNINKFELYNISDNKLITNSNFYQNDSIKISVYNFKAANKRILSDFYDLVDAANYPYILLEIIDINKGIITPSKKSKKIKTKITIAGKSYTYHIPYKIIHCNNLIAIKGNTEIKLSDFKIVPPKKIFGIIKVRDKVFVNFVFLISKET